MNVKSKISTNRKRPFSNLIVGLLALLLTYQTGYAQYEANYVELRAEGRIPDDFLNLVRGQSKINIRNTERISKVQRENFRDATNFALRDIFTNGNIYFNDPMTAYVRTIGEKLVKNSKVENKINFFVSKSTELNASSWQTGTVIINIGLLSRLENEAQLAYVLAHEIAHFQMQHPYRQYAQQIKNKEMTHGSHLAKNFREHFDFSLKYELEADSIALAIMKEKDYEVNESIKTLNILQHKEQRDVVNLTNYYSSPSFQLEENQLCDYKGYSAFKKSVFQVADAHFSGHHIKKRIKNLVDIVSRDYPEKEDLYSFKGSHYDPALFTNASKMAHFETIQQAFLESNYLKSIHEAMILIRDFPNNEFLHVKIAENLYHISHYNKLGLLDRIFFDNQRIDENEYAKLCCLVNNLNQSDLQNMIHGFIKKLYKDYSTNETMIITMAKSMEMNTDIKMAKPYYKKYVRLFPYGKHYLEAKRKIK